MATRTIVVCDRDEDEEPREAESVRFDLDGETYEIDLCDVHRRELEQIRETLGDYARTARAVGERTEPERPTRGKRAGETERIRRNRAIREWAAEHGHDLSPRGRIPDEIRDAYERAAPGGFVEQQIRREAEASVALDRDERAQTIALDERPVAELDDETDEEQDREPYRDASGVTRWRPREGSERGERPSPSAGPRPAPSGSPSGSGRR